MALALGYVANYGEDYDLVAWIDAERAELIPGQYRALVRNRIGQDLPETEAVTAAKALFANTENWLLVFDNASNPAELHPYLPAGEGQVLVTTRNETWSANAELILSLDKLPDPVVVEWLTRALPGSSADSIEGLAARLDGLPLAVVQAIAYIAARPGESATSYLARFATKSGQRLLLEAKTPPGYPHPVATTWDIATDTLADETPDALELLRDLAFVNPDRIPVGVLDELLPGTDTPALLEALRNLGMIRCSATHVSLHRLVQDVTRWPLGPEKEAPHVTHWASHLRGTSPDPNDHAAFEWYTEIAPHVLTLADHASALALSPLDLGVLAGDTGISLRWQAAYSPALTLLDRALRIFDAAHGPYHPDVAITLTHLGNAYLDLGDYQGAVQLYDRALCIFELGYDPDHPHVAQTLTNLGVAHQQLGHYREAIELLEGALRVFEAAHAPDHPDVANALGNLANTYNELGHHQKAIELYQRALGIFEAACGADHPRVAGTLTNLGNVLRELGRYQQAIEFHERALRIDEAAQGPDHPNVATTVTNLGNVHLELGHYQQAIELYERALHIVEAAYGPDHPQVASTLVSLGLAHRELDQHEKALKLQERALRIKGAAYGPDHPELGTTLVNLGLTYHELGHHEEAIELYEGALRIFEAAYGPDHPQLGVILSNLGAANRQLDQHEEALRLYRRALQVSEAAYGPDHPQVGVTLTNLGVAHQELGHEQKARRFYEAALRIFEAAYGPDHQYSLTVRCRLEQR